MTKYEWESRLKKNIQRLPAAEIKRLLEYYDELFADKIEQGKGEFEIIGEFGDPEEVANKILSEYDAEHINEGSAAKTPPVTADEKGNAEENTPARTDGNASSAAGENVPELAVSGNTEAGTEKTPPAKENGSAHASADGQDGLRTGRHAAFAVLNVLTGFAFAVLMAIIWIVAVVLAIVGAAFVIGGLFGAAVSVGVMVGGAVGSGIAQLGMSVALIGVGVILGMVMARCLILLAKATPKYFRALRNRLTAKKEDT